jgi:hypothetical protein
VHGHALLEIQRGIEKAGFEAIRGRFEEGGLAVVRVGRVGLRWSVFRACIRWGASGLELTGTDSVPIEPLRIHYAHAVRDAERCGLPYMQRDNGPLSGAAIERLVGLLEITLEEKARRMAELQREIDAAKLQVGAKADDGALIGVRAWKIERGGVLVSPYRETRWLGSVPTLTADPPLEEDADQAVRGLRGIHAAWPRSDMALPDSFEGISAPGIGRQRSAIGFVRGYPPAVVGDLGWRASRVIADAVYVLPIDRRRVAKKYPECVVGVWK